MIVLPIAKWFAASVVCAVQQVAVADMDNLTYALTHAG